MFDVNRYTTRFRINLLRASPFYGDVVSMLTFREDKSIETAATNGTEVLINPAFYERLTEGQRNFVTMHEVMHVLLMHPQRCKGRDPKMYNYAADLIVNGFLTRREVISFMQQYGIPFEQPDNGIFGTLTSYDTMETLYEKLMAIRDKKISVNAPTAMYRFREFDPGNKSLPPLKQDLIRPSDAQAQAMSDSISAMIRQSLQLNHDAARGTGPSFPIPNEVYNIPSGKILNWKKLLKRFMEEEPSDETSYTTPERKYLHMDLILPGHGDSEEKPQEIWAFIDCSGSISKSQTEEFLLQLNTLVKQFKCRMNVVYWDTQVHEVYRDIRTEKQVRECLPHFSGGTDINCVYSWIKSTDTHIDAMLILTDGLFGTLQEKNRIPQLYKRTLLVLSGDYCNGMNFSNIGKTARLGED